MDICLIPWNTNKVVAFQPLDFTMDSVGVVIGSAVIITVPTFEVRPLKIYNNYDSYPIDECVTVHESGIIRNLIPEWTREQVMSYVEMYRSLDTV